MAVCLHCEKTVTMESTRKDSSDEVQKEVEVMVKKEVMHSCPQCDEVLGFAFSFWWHRNGQTSLIQRWTSGWNCTSISTIPRR